MKHLRSLLTSIIAIVMVFAMSGLALAEGADGYYIKLDSKDTHEYKVYQVLIGTLANPNAENENELGNPAWGEDVIANPGDVNAFIESITKTQDGKPVDEQTVANLVYEKIDKDKGRPGKLTKDSPMTGLQTGYYIMVDVTKLTDDKETSLDTQARHVVRVVNNIDGMAIKWGSTEVEKVIAGDTLGKGEAKSYTPGVHVDNVSVGDIVNYEIVASIPANADIYNYFYFIINDTLDKGLDLKADSIEVTIDEVDIDDVKLVKDTDYVLKTGDEAIPCSFQIGLNDAKRYHGKKVVVTYSAVLNKDAEMGQIPNKNTSYVKFSNNPNHSYDGENHPGFPAEADDKAMGETPKTVTETYTTGIEIQKVDGEGKVLTGAKFKLSGNSIEKALTVTEKFVEDANGDYYKLKDGTFTKDKPTQDGQYMEKAASGATSGYVVDASYEGEGKVEIDNIIYRPYAPDMDADKDIYVLYIGNGYLYESTDVKYKKEVVKTLGDADVNGEEISIEKEVDANGLVRFDGLGATDQNGYTITEVVTPDGYNTLDPITVTVTFKKDGDNNYWTFSGSRVIGTYDSNEGIYKIKIQNNKGTALPSTGGIGTTIFYIVGGVMVAGAVVFLLTKRRVSGNE
jgi:fimbrial isopeptide formation D2 family protein/LPXTG-motif cell wall-anchored protein